MESTSSELGNGHHRSACTTFSFGEGMANHTRTDNQTSADAFECRCERRVPCALHKPRAEGGHLRRAVCADGLRSSKKGNRQDSNDEAHQHIIILGRYIVLLSAHGLGCPFRCYHEGHTNSICPAATSSYHPVIVATRNKSWREMRWPVDPRRQRCLVFPFTRHEQTSGAVSALLNSVYIQAGPGPRRKPVDDPSLPSP